MPNGAAGEVVQPQQVPPPAPAAPAEAAAPATLAQLDFETPETYDGVW